MFPVRHEPVTGQRNTPVVPSAHNRRVPVAMSFLFGPQPVAGRTETMRDVASGFTEVASQQMRGPGVDRVHAEAIPEHGREGRTRNATPEASTQMVTGAAVG